MRPHAGQRRSLPASTACSNSAALMRSPVDTSFPVFGQTMATVPMLVWRARGRVGHARCARPEPPKFASAQWDGLQCTLESGPEVDQLPLDLEPVANGTADIEQILHESPQVRPLA